MISPTIQELMKRGYTKEELAYNKKSLIASVAGSSLASFAFFGFSKSPKTRAILTGLGLAADIGLSNYYDIRSLKAAKNKKRNFAQSWIRGIGASIIGGHIGRSSAFFINSGLKILKNKTAAAAASESVRFYKATPVNEAAKLGNMAKSRFSNIVGFRRFHGRIIPIRSKTTRLGPALLMAPKR